MIYRCYKKERKECECSVPCELSNYEMQERLYRTTPCDFGEDDYFLESNPETEFFLLVVGTRNYDDYKVFSEKMDRAFGGAAGVDSMAEIYAKEHRYKFICFPADWSIGKSAGYIRNRIMHEYIAKYPNRGVLAFWDGKSKGTEHSFDLAKEHGNLLKVIRI